MELKPCPFCGGKVHLFPSLTFSNRFVIFCGKCFLQTLAYDDKEQLINDWNRRADDDAHRV